MQKERQEKNLVGAFHYPAPLFDFKKNSGKSYLQCIIHQKNSHTTHM